MLDRDNQLAKAVLLPDGMTVEDCLIEDRRKQDFIGKHLPFSLADDPTLEPVRYDIGDEWLDLIVLYFPGSGWEVQVLEKSCDDLDLGDVYMDLKERLRAELAVQPPPIASPVPSATLKEILIRLERLERQKPQTAKVDGPSVTSPYFTADEAVAYLRLGTIKSLYGLVERGRLVPLRGSRRRIRFTKEMLDQFMLQEGKKR
jgi:hypothetical protein